VSRFGLVAAFTIRSLYNSDNNIVSIELEISGALFLPCGHYITMFETDWYSEEN